METTLAVLGDAGRYPTETRCEQNGRSLLQLLGLVFAGSHLSLWNTLGIAIGCAVSHASYIWNIGHFILSPIQSIRPRQWTVKNDYLSSVNPAMIFFSVVSFAIRSSTTGEGNGKSTLAFVQTYSQSTPDFRFGNQ